MRPKSLILLVLALGCGLIAAVGINQIMARPSAEGETVTIVVAKKEILKGDLIKPDDIRLQDWRRDALPEGAIEKIEDLQDKRVKTAIYPGEPILTPKLVTGKDEIEIPAGMKGVTVSVDAVSIMGGLVKPGDNVDVYWHVEANQSKGIMATITKVLLRNIKVLAVDSSLERPETGEEGAAASAKTVMLMVSEKDAMNLTMASQAGTIRLIARSSRDAADAEDTNSTATIDGLLNGTGQTTSTGSPTSSVSGIGIQPLPPVTPDPLNPDTAGPSLGNRLIDILVQSRNGSLPEPKKPNWRLVLIEGPDAKEVEFDGDSRLAKVVGAGESTEEESAAPFDIEPLRGLGGTTSEATSEANETK